MNDRSVCISFFLTIFVTFLFMFQGWTQELISDDQVESEMTQYLTALHDHMVDFDRVKLHEQLNFIRKIKELWKIPEFRRLRALPVEDILKNEKQNPFFLTALAFHLSEVGPNHESLITADDRPDVERAKQFRSALTGQGLYFYQNSYAADDVGFDLNLIDHLLLLNQSAPFQITLDHMDLSNYTIVKTQNLNHLDYIHSSPNSSLDQNNYVFSNEKNPPTVTIWDIEKDELRDQRLIQFSDNPTPEAVTIMLYQNHQCTLGGNFFSKISFGRSCPEASDFLFQTRSNGDIWMANDNWPSDTWRVLTTGRISPIDMISIHPNGHTIAYKYSDEDEIYIGKIPNWDQGNDVEYRDGIDVSHILGQLKRSIDHFQFNSLGDFVIEAEPTVDIWKADPPHMTHKQTIDTPKLRVTGIKKIVFNQDSIWMAILRGDGYVDVYQRNEASPSLETLLLFDPATVTPATGGGGGK